MALRAPAGSEGETKAAAASSAVKLLEAGAEPRKAIRMHPKVDDKQTVNMSIKMTMEMGAGDAKMPAMNLPPIVLTFDFIVKSLSPDGVIGYEFSATDVSIGEDPNVLPQIADAMKNSLGSLKGMSGKGTISDRGMSKGVDFKAPAGSDPTVRQAFDQMKDAFSKMSTPFPEDPIGPGAKWQIQMPVKSQGMTIDQTTTYELASLDDEKASIKVTLAQRAANQKIANPTMPGVKVDVSKLTGSGSGDLTQDLSQIIPLSSTMDARQDMSMAVNTGGQKQEMTMGLAMNIKLESK